MAGQDDYKTISTTVTDVVTEVRFYTETVEHIKANHPEVPIELPCITGAIETCIVDPTYIEDSRNNSVVFVDEDSTNSEGYPLRIPIKRIEEKSGLLKTAFFGPTTENATIIYRKRKP
ncbi:MAG TPA: hypothetical protein VHC39_05980 [Rhizomicrobium sp.]|nr:hypothetical protein [Rhizomicrobium sp.]